MFYRKFQPKTNVKLAYDQVEEEDDDEATPNVIPTESHQTPQTGLSGPSSNEKVQKPLNNEPAAQNRKVRNKLNL